MKRLSADRLPRCINCRRMLYINPEGECQNCCHLADMKDRQQRALERREAVRAADKSLGVTGKWR